MKAIAYTADGQEKEFKIEETDELEQQIPFIVIQDKNGAVRHIINMAECQAITFTE